MSGKYELGYIEPYTIIEIEYSASIKTCSPMFIKIYNQANVAEIKGLDEIAGVGYRKSIEFLIKDYIISKNENEETIKSTSLGNCIKKYIDDPKIRVCAERATWLGNDETHYIRKWTNKDISDLKTLIKITTNWIESSLLTEEYLKAMPE
jgi:hypothetical protein